MPIKLRQDVIIYHVNAMCGIRRFRVPPTDVLVPILSHLQSQSSPCIVTMVFSVGDRQHPLTSRTACSRASMRHLSPPETDHLGQARLVWDILPRKSSPNMFPRTVPIGRSHVPTTRWERPMGLQY